MTRNALVGMLADLRESDLARRLQDGESAWEIRRELRARRGAGPTVVTVLDALERLARDSACAGAA